jgi:hypothetical protein
MLNVVRVRPMSVSRREGSRSSREDQSIEELNRGDSRRDRRSTQASKTKKGRSHAWVKETLKSHEEACGLKASAVDNRRTSFVVLSLGDPHLLESREGGKD